MWRCLVNCEVLESVEPQTGRTALMTAVVFEQRERGLQIEFIRLLLNSSAALHAVDSVRDLCALWNYTARRAGTRR